jgi:hypothetical protein
MHSIDRSASEVDAKLTAGADHGLRGVFGLLLSQTLGVRCCLEPFEHGRLRIVIAFYGGGLLLSRSSWFWSVVRSRFRIVMCGAFLFV